MRCTANLVVLLSLLWAGACVTSAVQPSTKTARDTTAAASEWREMTWSEYYMGVMQDANRRGAMVIWIDPPQVHKASRKAQPTAAPSSQPQ